MEPQSSGSSPVSPGKPSSEELLKPSVEMEKPPEEEEAAGKPDRRSSSSSSSKSRASSAECMFHVEAAEMSAPLVAEVAPEIVDDHAAASGCGPEPEEAKPGDWVSWPEDPAPAVDDPPRSDGGKGLTQPPETQTMAMPAAAPADTGFNPNRIPASIFQAKPSSQAEWSITSNESLFSIQGAGMSDDLGGLYSSSRSHFDYFYDEAIAAAGGGEPDWKLPSLAEGTESAVPGSAASADSARANNAMAIRRHESGSAGSSSNLSFAFPILTETSPVRRDSAGGYYQLGKEYEQPAPPSDPASEFVEMTTEEERRRRRTGWCGQCCGCCWFACSWPSCSSCCCQQWRSRFCSCPSCPRCCYCCHQWWWQCCSCSCPSCCRCRWCL